MNTLESTHIVASLVKRLRQSTALGCDVITHQKEDEIDEEDVDIYAEYVGGGRFQRLKQCAFDSLNLIREAVEPVDFTWNPGISDTDKEAILELYPIAKCALDCISNQLDDVLDNAAAYKEVADDSSTLTFEGLFLITKTILEMLNPVVLALEMSVFSILMSIMEKSRPLKPLLNACMGCISTYLCRLFSADISQDIQEGVTSILSQLKHLFEQVLSLAIANDDDKLNADAIAFLKIVTNTVVQRLGYLSSGKCASISETQVTFITRVINCWYGVLVSRIMQLRADMLHSSVRPVKLAKLLKAIVTFPTLPAAHRLRLVLQVALTLRQDYACAIQVETLSTIIALMEIDSQDVSPIMRSNIHPLSEALIEVLFDRRLCGNSQGATDKTDCEKQVQLVYCIAQCIRVTRTVQRDPNSQVVDEFLQKQILTLLNMNVSEPEEGTARIERMIRETEHLPELSKNFPTLDDFMAARDDCDLLTRLIRMFDYLLTYHNQQLDEAIALVVCWLFQEFEFVLCLKITAPLCLQYLRTKRSKMLDELHNINPMSTGLASVAQSAMSRWTMGGRMFSTALEAYGRRRTGDSMDTDAPGIATQPMGIFASLFEATIDIAKETAGNIPKDLEECIGIYVKMFGIEPYLRLLPLNALCNIPITSDLFKSESYVYMLPILQRQLKGGQLVIYVKHFLPVVRQVESLLKRTKECVSINTTNEAMISHAARSYEGVVDMLYNILIAMATSAEDCKVALEMNDFELLKHILELLDQGTNRTTLSCKCIAACKDLEGIAPRLIGVMVKRFVALATSLTSTTPETQNTMYAVEDALLSAISNCGRFCDSKMLAENLQSFEAALKRSGSSSDPLVKISRALLPSVDDLLKLQLHNHWIDLLKTEPSRSVYLALKRSSETVAAEVARTFPLNNKEASQRSPEDVAKATSYVKHVCSLDGLRSLSVALNVMPEAQPKEENEEHCKHRICCISAFVRLLETMKLHGVYDDATKQFVDSISKPLVLEAMINVTAPNANTRSSALCIYDSICMLKLEEIGEVLKLSISALTCGASKAMQISLVMCLTRLVALHSQEAVKYNLSQVLAYIFRLLSEDNIKLYVQLLKFARVCIVRFNRERVQWLAPMMMRMFENEACCHRARVFVRRVTEKLLHKLTRDQMMKMFPPAHLPLLRSIIAAKRKKRHSKLRRALKAHDEDDNDEEFLDGMFKTDDEGRLVVTMAEPDDLEAEDEAIPKEGSGRKQQKKVRQKSRKKSDMQPYTYIKLNRAKAGEKHKRENVRALKSLVKNKGT